MNIVVNDTSILIDLISIDLFEKAILLEFDFRTYVFIINEIKDKDQQEAIAKEACEKLKKLFQINPRLPRIEVENRLTKWKDHK